MWGGGTRPRLAEPSGEGRNDQCMRRAHGFVKIFDAKGRRQDGSRLWKYFLKTIPTGE